ncbi:hypothetical protein [Rubrivirga sp. IMCC43871]|uniref:hypothetical protein n=1 Tax=Rubrivirga sp. IMCC43871 TaxID=3391575 RepID=UPI0039900508
MRRRLALAALVLDGICALAAPVVLAQSESDGRYVAVAGACVERIETLESGPDTLGGRLVDDALCR